MIHRLVERWARVWDVLGSILALSKLFFLVFLGFLSKFFIIHVISVTLGTAFIESDRDTLIEQSL